MALRVLLADESSTIKKVMQLALQDFGVEVKSVPIGLDVLQVARTFNPDIIFADVLLAKKNGYEVAAELKSDSLLKKIPIVLMWSGFMDIDEPKARSSRADRRLEKPFDADTLRQLVKDLVPALGSNVIANYLTFPEMPEMVEDSPSSTSQPTSPAMTRGAPPPASPANRNSVPRSPPPPANSDRTFVQINLPKNESENDNFQLGDESASEEIQLIDMEFDKTRVGSVSESHLPSVTNDINFPDFGEIEEPEEFQSIPLPKNQGLPPAPKAKPHQDDWSRQDLSRYRIELPEEDPVSIDESELTHSSIALSSGADDISLDQLDELEDLTTVQKPQPRPAARPMPPKSSPPPKTFPTSSDFGSAPAPTPSMVSSLDPMRAEEVLRQEARAVLENIAWKLLPEIVERVVREELQKLLKDAEHL